MASVKIHIANVARLSLDFRQICLGNFHSFFMLWKQLLSSVLAEASLDHLLNLQCFNTKKIEYHIIRQSELRAELRRISENHLSELCHRWSFTSTRSDNND